MLWQPVGKHLALQKIDPDLTIAAVSDVACHDVEASRFDGAGHGAIATARFPDRTAQRHAVQQCLGDPVRRRIKIILLTIVARNMDRAGVTVGGDRPRIIQYHSAIPFNPGPEQLGMQRFCGGQSVAGIEPIWEGLCCNLGARLRDFDRDGCRQTAARLRRRAAVQLTTAAHGPPDGTTITGEAVTDHPLQTGDLLPGTAVLRCAPRNPVPQLKNPNADGRRHWLTLAQGHAPIGG